MVTLLISHLGCVSEVAELVTMSAGNYGKSFGYAALRLGLAATVVMPDTAPPSRGELLASWGLTVERLPSARLLEAVKTHEAVLHTLDLSLLNR